MKFDEVMEEAFEKGEFGVAQIQQQIFHDAYNTFLKETIAEQRSCSVDLH